MHEVPPLSANVMGWLQALAWVATAVGIVVTGVKFGIELRLTREQRERDLRWKQAEAGKALNDEMLEDPRAWLALQMLDYPGRTFKLLPSEKTVVVTHDDVRRALDPVTQTSEDKLLDIRDCFDSFFYYLAAFEHRIQNTLILPEDVAYPMEYYVRLLAKFRPQVDAYLRHYELDRSQAFLAKYPEWRGTQQRRGEQLRDCPKFCVTAGEHRLERASTIGGSTHGNRQGHSRPPAEGLQVS
jgi:hypothetical protein